MASSWNSLRAAAHSIDLEERTWVDALFTEARALFDEGLGMFVYSYTIAPRQGIRLGSLSGEQTGRAFWKTLEAWGAENQLPLARIYKTGVSSVNEAARPNGQRGALLSNVRARFEPHAVGDVLTIVGHDVEGFGVFLTTPRVRCSAERLPGVRRSLERLAAELAAAVRLRANRRAAQFVRLSMSERLVADRLVQGASDKAIAYQLGVALSTVSTFTRRIRTKLGCHRGEEAFLLSPPASLERLHHRLDLFDRLTAAECDVASDLLVGSSYAEMAVRRGSSVRTVASQCAAIFRKCGVSGRRELAATLLGESAVSRK